MADLGLCPGAHVLGIVSPVPSLPQPLLITGLQGPTCTSSTVVWNTASVGGCISGYDFF